MITIGRRKYIGRLLESKLNVIKYIVRREIKYEDVLPTCINGIFLKRPTLNTFAIKKAT